MSREIVEKTKKTAELYFKDVSGERPFDLWRSFDKELAKDLSFEALLLFAFRLSNSAFLFFLT